ncbi:alanine/ornithine racemase family PLP-dependent enzyme [Lutibacter sp. B2]|nr:alanine/ornithine racemase family PLP-dependent enzyme [Lutibacter sp. B2]
MSKYPKIIVDLKKLEHNAKIVTKLCGNHNIDLAAVTKVYCGNPEIAKTTVAGGVKMLADSRVENLIRLKDIDVPKLYLRVPMMSEVEEVVKYADISLNSEIKTIEKLSEVAVKENKVHNIILMVDLGDLREGVWPKDVIDTVEKVLKYKGVHLIGLGTNLTCYGGVIPKEDNLGKLVEIAKDIEEKFNIELEIISGGNSSSIHLVTSDKIPCKINNLRLGEAIVLGTESSYGQNIEDTYQDVFMLAAQIVELKEKPSIPIGEIGVDAFGNKPTFTDRGIRKRAILAVGRQDIYPEKLMPIDGEMIILGASSDHLIVDVTDCDQEYKVGDEIRFNLKYPAILQLFTSEYVFKEIK